MYSTHKNDIRMQKTGEETNAASQHSGGKSHQKSKNQAKSFYELPNQTKRTKLIVISTSHSERPCAENSQVILKERSDNDQSKQRKFRQQK
jgi:hypothetical protein